LDVNFEVMDILGKANYNNLVTRYGYVSSGTYSKSDMRVVRLTYTIFNKSIRANATRNNTDILRRI